jgi:hypothetical protein
MAGVENSPVQLPSSILSAMRPGAHQRGLSELAISAAVRCADSADHHGMARIKG